MTAKKDSDVPEADLDVRQAEILKSIIRAHILTGEPVGSRTVSRGTRLDLSPASIRNVMAELAERGLLTQPHASAGRMPTAKAYRVYVDRMIRRPRMSTSDTQAIERALSESQGEIPHLLGEASRQLSRFSNQVGVVLAPELRRIVVEHLEFVRLDAHRVVAIIVGRSGMVHNRIVPIDEPLEQFELDQIGRYLSDEFGGRTLPEIRDLLSQRLSEERAAYDRKMARGLELGRRTIDAETRKTEVYVDGTSNLLDSPEFADPDKMRALLQALERRRTLLGLLGRVLEGEGVQVVIGDESHDADLAQVSLVASSYGSGERVMGTLGIVGPTRMEYARAIALVDHLARVLSRFFSGSDN